MASITPELQVPPRIDIEFASQKDEGILMGIRVTWENEEKTAIYIRYSRPCALTDFDAAELEIQRLASGVPQTVDLLFDLSEMALMPLPLDTMDKFIDATKRRFPNRGKLIFIGADLFAKTAVRAIEMMAEFRNKGQKMLFASTREQAHLVLAQGHS